MTRLRAVLLASVIGLAPFGAGAETLADIRAELAQLSASLQSLKGELVSSNRAMQQAGGASALDRMNTLETELMRLTGRTEELENRISRVVADGTTRVGDIEFRLCEMETGCDVSNIGATKPLGGGTATGGAAAAGGTKKPSSAASGGASLAVGEQGDFDRAKGVLDQGDFRGAADLFATFAQTYTGGTLTTEALYLRGEALAKSGDQTGAARAYLDAFTSNQTGPRAGDSLVRLGAILGELGQTQDACVTLSQVGTRFAGTQSQTDATAEMRRLGCP